MIRSAFPRPFRIEANAPKTLLRRSMYRGIVEIEHQRTAAMRQPLQHGRTDERRLRLHPDDIVHAETCPVDERRRAEPASMPSAVRTAWARS